MPNPEELGFLACADRWLSPSGKLLAHTPDPANCLADALAAISHRFDVAEIVTRAAARAGSLDALPAAICEEIRREWTLPIHAAHFPGRQAAHL
jgi:hypothetical protein